MGELYEEYLNTPEWKCKREKIIEKYNGKCAFCGSEARSVVHHLSYKSFDWWSPGSEYDSDLICMCDSCHHMLHESVNKKKSAILKFKALYEERIGEVRKDMMDEAVDIVIGMYKDFLTMSMASKWKEKDPHLNGLHSMAFSNVLSSLCAKLNESVDPEDNDTIKFDVDYGRVRALEKTTREEALKKKY